MFELYLSHTSAGEHSTDPRNRFHQTALHEARLASEFRREQTVALARPSFTARLRHAFTGGPSATTEACNCPA